MLKPETNLEWAYFAATTVQAAAITALQLTVLFRYLDWVNPVIYQVPLSYTAPISIAVFVGGCIYQSFLTIDAFRIKNNIQLFAQCICNICLSISSAMQYGQIKKAVHRVTKGYDMFHTPFAKLDIPFWSQTNPLLIAGIVVVFGCTVAMCYLAYKLHREFAWALYKDISADINIRSRYLTYQVYLVLIKLSLYFLIAFIIVYGFVNVHYVQPEFSLTIGIIPVSILQIGLAVYYTRVEAALGMAFTILVYLAGIAYLISRIIVLCGNSLYSKTTLKDEQLLFAIVAIFFIFAATVSAVQCWLNFGKGLKPILLGQTQRKAPQNEEEREYYFQRLNYAPSAVDVGGNRRFALD